MFRTLGTLAIFTLIGATLHKYSGEIFGALAANDGGSNGGTTDQAPNKTQTPNYVSAANETPAAPLPVSANANGKRNA